MIRTLCACCSEAVFRRAGTRALPIVFIGQSAERIASIASIANALHVSDDKYIGDYDVVAALDKNGQLDKLLNTMQSK